VQLGIGSQCIYTGHEKRYPHDPTGSKYARRRGVAMCWKQGWAISMPNENKAETSMFRRRQCRLLLMARKGTLASLLLLYNLYLPNAAKDPSPEEM
jgi:hypothetical protein